MTDLRNTLERLSPAQRAELARRLGVQAPKTQQLVAYVLPQGDVSGETLRDHVRARLPDYMVPATVVTLDALPRLPNGKVNRAALPEPAAPAGSALRAAQPESASTADPATETLLKIWRDVLGMDQIGPHDDFFELGGDSILSIQIIARAARAGITIKPRQLFENPTVAQLVALAGQSGPQAAAGAAPVEKRAPALPIHCWLLEQPLRHPEHWNQALLLRATAPLDARALAAALRGAIAAHGALRTRFTRSTDGAWWQELADAPVEVTVERHDVAALTEAARAEAIARVADQLHRRMDLSAPVLLQAALFDAGAHRDVLLIAHHLAIDVVSWPVLVESLQSTILQQPGPMSPDTAALVWSRRLAEHANSAALKTEAAYWLREDAQHAALLPVDLPGGTNRVRDAAQISVQLNDAHTRGLLDLPRARRMPVQEALNIAFAQALSAWRRAPQVLFDTEGHGREALFDDLDVSRAVGWFTTVYPLALRVADDVDDLKRQLRQVPQQGIGHGLLLHYSADAGVRGRLRALPQAQALFAYLGQAPDTRDAAALFAEIDAAVGDAPLGAARAPDDPRRYLLDVNARVRRGRLEMAWTYSAAMYRAETIRALAEDVLERVRRLCAPADASAAGAVGTADGFELLDMDAADMDQLARLLGE